MNGVAVACPGCRGNLPDGALDTPGLTPCPYCGTQVRVATFPALAAGYLPGLDAQRLQADREASCFYHPSKRAVVPCDRCGRFLCSLCDVQMGAQHLCPGCVDSTFGGTDEGRTSGNRRFLYDSLALALATWPLLIWVVSFLTAPLAIFVAVRYWKKPCGVFRWAKARFLIAIGLASLQIAGWALGIYALITFL